MVHRTKALIAAAVLLAPFQVAASRPALRLVLPTGPRHAAVAPQTEVSLQWIIRARDVITCETPAPDLRRLRHQYRERIAVTAYVVSSDTALVRSFLRNERLGAVNVVAITDNVFQHRFASTAGRPAATPMVVLTRPGAPPNAYFADVRTAAGRANVEELVTQLSAYFRSHDGSRLALTREEKGGEE